MLGTNSATKASGRLISDAEKIMQANYVRGVDGDKGSLWFRSYSW